MLKPLRICLTALLLVSLLGPSTAADSTTSAVSSSPSPVPSSSGTTESAISATSAVVDTSLVAETTSSTRTTRHRSSSTATHRSTSTSRHRSSASKSSHSTTRHRSTATRASQRMSSSSSKPTAKHRSHTSSTQQSTTRRAGSAASGIISYDPGVYPGGGNSYTTGWRELPDVAGARIDTTSFITPANKGALTAYITEDYDASRIKRAVIQVHGANRDAWNQFLYANLSLGRAVAGGVVDSDEVVIVAPQFFTTIDHGAFPVDSRNRPTGDVLVWPDTAGWGDGTPAINPDGGNDGSFEALDAVSSYLLDRTKFPNMVTVVVAGFSLGGQLVQRYSTLRPPNSDDDSRINYWISSPNAFLYLSPDRPLPIDGCRGSYNKYKYGLDGTLPDYVSSTRQSNSMNLNTLSARLLSRRISYTVGKKDTAAGSSVCTANTQGKGHLSKMFYWTEQTLPALPGSTGQVSTLPTNSSVAYVDDVSHQDWRMIQSDSGVFTLFLEDYNARGQNATAPGSNGLTSTGAGSITLTPANDGSNDAPRFRKTSKKKTGLVAGLTGMTLLVLGVL